MKKWRNDIKQIRFVEEISLFSLIRRLFDFHQTQMAEVVPVAPWKPWRIPFGPCLCRWKPTPSCLWRKFCRTFVQKSHWRSSQTNRQKTGLSFEIWELGCVFFVPCVFYYLLLLCYYLFPGWTCSFPQKGGILCSWHVVKPVAYSKHKIKKVQNWSLAHTVVCCFHAFGRDELHKKLNVMTRPDIDDLWLIQVFFYVPWSCFQCYGTTTQVSEHWFWEFDLQNSHSEVYLHCILDRKGWHLYHRTCWDMFGIPSS